MVLKCVVRRPGQEGAEGGVGQAVGAMPALDLHTRRSRESAGLGPRTRIKQKSVDKATMITLGEKKSDT